MVGKELRTAIAMAVTIGAMALPASASATDIWDQNSGGSGQGVWSQQDNPPTNPAPSELADDFFIPVGSPLTIRGVTVSGHYDAGTALATSVDVRFYQDAGTLPGALITDRLGVVPNGLATGDFEIPLSPGVELATGNYWVSVMANGLDYSSQIWDWDIRPLQGTTDPAAQRTSNLPLCMAPTWFVRSAAGTPCAGFASEPDQMFSLSSTAPVVPVNPPPPTPVTPAPATTKKCKKGFKLKKGKCKKKKKKKRK